MISQCRAALLSKLETSRQTLAQSHDVKSTASACAASAGFKPVLLAEYQTGADTLAGVDTHRDSL
jgi:hypothetical protein